MNESALTNSKEEKVWKFQSTPLTHIKNKLPHAPVLCLVMFNPLQPQGLQPIRILHHLAFPGGFSRQEYWSGLPVGSSQLRERTHVTQVTASPEKPYIRTKLNKKAIKKCFL